MAAVLLLTPAAAAAGQPAACPPEPTRTNAEMGGLYAPVVLTTHRDVSTIPPDLTKRMVTCHIDAAIPENRSVTERLARRAHKEVGTALYRAYLQRLLSEVRAMRGRIDADDEFGAEGFPDLLACSSAVLRGVLGEALGEVPGWACALTFNDHFGRRHRHFRDRLHAMLADAEDRVTVNRGSGEIAVSFGGDTNQAAQFARGVPDFVLKGRFADVVRLDLRALEGGDGLCGRQAGRLVGEDHAAVGPTLGEPALGEVERPKHKLTAAARA